jgi:CheY-like chemotaxis protein
MNTRGLPIILIAEDDPGDRVLLQEAFQAAGTLVDLRLVASGKEFLEYLYRRPPWEWAERPDLVLLDLNMPETNGREALREIKEHHELKSIPVVVLTTSRAPEDVLDAYAIGANTYIPKPASFDGLLNTVRAICEFWFKLCVVPGAVER